MATTGQTSTVGAPRRLSTRRALVAGALCGLLTAAAPAAVVRFSGPPLCQMQDNGFGCVGTMGILSLLGLMLLVTAWAGLWWWAGSQYPWAVALRGMPIVLGGLVVLGVGAAADGLRAVSFAVTEAQNDLHTAVLVLLWLACLGAAALVGAALWVARRRRRAALLVPALVVALVGADALAAVGVLGWQTWRIRAVAPHPYALVDPALTLELVEVRSGALMLSYSTADGAGVDVTVAGRPDGVDLTAPCSPTVTTPLGRRIRACGSSDATVPGGLVWSTLPADTAQGVGGLVVLEPDALVMITSNAFGATGDTVLPRLTQLRRTGVVTLLRAAERTVDVR